MSTPTQHPDEFLSRSFNFLREFCLFRLGQYLGSPDNHPAPGDFVLPEENDSSPLARFLLERKPSQDEFLLLLMALAPYAFPNFFDALVSRFLPQGGEFQEFGGVKSGNCRGTMPTGETALLLLAGNDLAERMRVQRLLRFGSFFNEEHLVSLDPVRPGEPPMSGRLTPDPEIAEWLLTGHIALPKMSTDFPAQYIATELEWDDLILDPQTLVQIRELEHWLLHRHSLHREWGMYRKLKPGYRALFYGPPGAGKTMTASLLGKYSGLPVFRIDLSMVVSKYIGETEKNLSTLFDKAQHKNWILFFDEADSLFGKRTGVRDAHDKYANQEVSYLLQRVESHPGLVILASNFKNNIDDAFTRRFNAILHFPQPKPAQRLQLWQKAFPPQVAFAPDIEWTKIAERYEMTGSNIMNITEYCCIELLAQDTNMLHLELLTRAIRREFAKEGKIL